MKILTIADSPIHHVSEHLESMGIETQTITPNELNTVWLSQFHVIYIQNIHDRTDYKNLLIKIRNLNWQIPILLPYPAPDKINNSFLIPKDITPNELALTTISLLRSRNKKKNRKLKYKDLILDPSRRVAKRRNQKTELRQKEYGILEIMMRNPETTVTKDQIVEQLWDSGTILLSNTLTVHMSRLREKIDKGFTKKLIHTIPCVGYRLEQID